MTARTFELRVCVVHSPYDAQLLSNSEATLRTRDDLAEVAARTVHQILRERIGADRLCSLVITSLRPEGS